MKRSSYGSWRSPITSDLIVAGSIALSEVRLDHGHAYWVEGRPEEGGRGVVVCDGQDATPQPFHVRTRVHEYGGGAWAVAEGVLYFSHDGDRRLYRMRPGEAPAPLTPEGSWRYADGVIDAQRGLWIGIREDHTTGGEPVNTIVAIPLKEPARSSGHVLATGHDFYASPRLSPDCSRLTFLAWDHPYMPWMGTTLYTMTLSADGATPGEPVPVAGGLRESIFQPEWMPDGSGLIFISDRSGWWNLYRHAFDGSVTTPLAPMEAEFGLPQWVFGLSTYAFAGPRRLVCSYSSQGLGRFATLDLDSGSLMPIELPYTDFSSVRAEGDDVLFRAGSAGSPASIVRLDLASGKLAVLRKATTLDESLAEYFTKVQAVEFPTAQNRTAFGLFYPAYNPDYQAPEGEKPPLLVKCHGGPTSSAPSTLDLRIQYWTSRGISVLDVNYGGSTGFGREYRERLDGNWGVVDVEDCVHGARHLAAQDLVDGARSVISGGSAGGYTVLAALTFHDYFRGGASHYGISDLAAMAGDTHKFESRYLDSLVGPYPERADLYRERSAISYVDRLSVPVIFFQGDEDAVVPPNQTELMVEALRRKGLPVGYLLFSGEQHGFRKAANIRRSLDAELYFYAVNVFRVGLEF